MRVRFRVYTSSLATIQVVCVTLIILTPFGVSLFDFRGGARSWAGFKGRATSNSRSNCNGISGSGISRDRSQLQFQVVSLVLECLIYCGAQFRGLHVDFDRSVLMFSVLEPRCDLQATTVHLFPNCRSEF